MPPINDYKCSECGFSLPRGWGYHFYVTDEDGKRIVCPHPVERSTVEGVLGKHPPFELVVKRTGFTSDCICLDCLFQFNADLGENGWSPYYINEYRVQRDKRECSKCCSKNVKTVSEMVGKTCPRCKKGIIEEVSTGLIA